MVASGVHAPRRSTGQAGIFRPDRIRQGKANQDGGDIRTNLTISLFHILSPGEGGSLTAWGREGVNPSPGTGDGEVFAKRIPSTRLEAQGLGGF